MNTEKFSQYAQANGELIAQLHKDLESLRRDAKGAIDVDFDELAKDESSINLTMDELLEELGINPAIDTLDAIINTGDMNVRWIIPEIIRKAIRVGLRSAPIWPSITAMEMDTTQKKVTMPYLNMSDAAPRKVNEGETITMGNVSYGDKTVEVFKIGRGIKIPYEVIQFVSIDVISLFLQDFGIKLGHALDTLAINVLLNGDQADGSAAAPVIGVATANTKVYRDFLRPWVRGSRMGRLFNTIIGGELAALDTLDLTEFKTRQASGPTFATLNMKTPVPNEADYYVHGNVPANQEILLDKRFGLIKMNVIPLLIESEKIISNQTFETYATLTTGFSKMFKDSALILDKSVAFSSNGFPSYMDVDAQLNVPIQ
jgi:hypothetical protein